MDNALFPTPFPPFVAFVALGPDAEAEPLHPSEAAAVHPRAVSGRRRDFALGRTAARLALAQLGRHPVAILRGEHREPLWPHDVIGSLTHAAGWVMAAVAHTRDCGGIGLDLEHRNRYFPDLVNHIAFEDERTWLAELPADRHAAAVLEVFSAKESIYKAFFPRVGRFFGFDAARLAPPSAAAPREAWLHHALDPVFPPGRRFPIQVQWNGDLVLTAVALAADD
jgi:4'-phosphopantetheinyl transferase EntD